MRVLSIYEGESIAINDYVRVVVVGIRGDEVRIGIEVPPEAEDDNPASVRRFLKQLVVDDDVDDG